MSNKPVSEGNNKRDGKKSEVSPAARRKQIIVGVVMGTVMGVILGALTTFWLWVPAGVAFGLAVGAIMKPPAE
ncbi:HPP family protein [Leucobacter coleopterorum]|uniref:HPP family protein n=1 Tax=Leucobacter coleopterorum TaxID=2714933 RepID=A0ABX6JY42_9MICO|nr:HPP family protein [Leucobacter coleopterorum]QIM19239.1 HPP family protein [Leucobacter coleopterorum]